MNKEELKKYLEGMELEEGLRKVLFEIVDKAEAVNNTLLDTIADILDLQADFYDKSADLLDEEAEIYKTLAEDLNALPESPTK
ncbi:hypothetical protein KJ980_03870 [Patescibacteria group bacterium]|nr:hypothetical protein [Patescibacteria group bacterium]MBU4016830.1 hypothetical protein [Patescibacteria group bacterium]MBU4098761.1 hypothetical protein [Patescibacteria group bacterium]